MKRLEALSFLKSELAGFEAAELRHIVSFVLGITIPEIYISPAEEISAEQEEKLREIVSRRKQREPLAYILGEWDFMGLSFYVDRSVLIPRQDTETLAEAAIAYAKEKGTAKALDICTGSGCIAVSVKKALPGMEMKASDISGAALLIAKENAERNLTDIEFMKADLFCGIDGTFGLITANPPYIAEDEYAELQEEIVRYEPKLALTADENGLFLYRRIAKEAKRILNGRIFLEIGWKQADDVMGMLRQEGYTDIYKIKDLSGNDRVISGEYIK